MPNFKFSKATFYLIIFPIVTLSLIFIGNYFIYAWNEPSLNPPNGNLSLPTSAWANITSGGGIYYNGAVRSGDNQAARARLDIGAPANGTSAIFTDNTNSGLRVRHPASNIVGLDVDTNNNLVFTHNNGGTERMRLTSAGNLGIGQPAPAYKLDVSGDINFTGTLRQNGTPFSSGGAGCPPNYSFQSDGSSGGLSGSCIYDPPAYSASAGSSILLHSNPSPVTINLGSMDANIVKSTRIKKGGTYKICYYAAAQCCWIQTQIYRNGVAVAGTNHSLPSTPTISTCDVVSGWSANDTIELHGMGGCAACVSRITGSDFNIYVDVPAQASVYPVIVQ